LSTACSSGSERRSDPRPSASKRRALGPPPGLDQLRKESAALRKQRLATARAGFEQALQRDDVKDRLLKLALYPGYLGPDAFAAQIKDDQVAFKRVLTKLGMIKQ